LIRIGLITQEEVEAKSFKCVHRNMLVTKLLPKLKEELFQAKQKLPNNYVPLGEEHTTLLHSPIDFDSPTSIDLASAVNICFDCSTINNSDEELTSFFHSLVHDLQLRGQATSFQTTTLQAQATLVGIMILESTITRLEAEIEYIETNASTSAYLTENACPCSLHLEMQIMLKLTTTIIRNGLKRACYNSKHELQSAKAFFARVELVL
jgi:hypothetical protein